MLRTLRWRFILSHVLPLSIVIPVMGIVLIYVLETQVLLSILSRELEGQALLAAKIAASRPESASHSAASSSSPSPAASFASAYPGEIASAGPAPPGAFGQPASDAARSSVASAGSCSPSPS